MLLTREISSLQNFWYILRNTWESEIKIQYKHPEQSLYHKHILSGNNGNIKGIRIADQTQAEIFLFVVSIVFDLRLHLNKIEGKSFSTTKIKPSNNKNNIKTLNVRQFMGSALYEPWISTSLIANPVQVLSLFVLCCVHLNIGIHILPL